MAIESLDEAKATARLIQSGQLAGPARDKAMAALREFDTRQTAPKLGDAVPALAEGPGTPQSEAANAAYKAIPATPIRDALSGVVDTVSAPLAPLKAAVLGTPEFLMQGASSVGAGLKGIAVGGGQAILNQIPGAPHENAMEAANRAVEGSTYSPQLKPSQDLAEGVGRINEGLGKGAGTLARKTGVPEPIANEIEMQLPNAINTGLALTGGPKAAVERPALTIKHAVDADGIHTVTSPNGTTTAKMRGDYLQSIETNTAPGAQGKGEGLARTERLIAEAEKNGKVFASDLQVTPAAQKLYAKLKERGYKVKQNSAETLPDGTLRGDAGRPVFEVEPVTKTDRGQMTPKEIHADDVSFLLENDVPLTTEQRGTNLARKIVGGAARGADAILGESPTRAAQDQAVTSAALKTVGVDAKNASPEVMGKIKSEISNEYNVLLAESPTKVTPELVEKLNELAEEAKMHPNASAIIARIDHIKKQVQAGDGTSAPVIPGKAAQSIRAGLNEAMGSTHSDVVHMSGRIKDVLDDAYDASATPEQIARMDAVRGRFHRMRQIEEAVKGSASHTISPSKLLTALERKRNRNQSMYGNTPDPMDAKLNRLARAGKNVLKEPVGNSGTPARLLGGAAVAAVTEAMLGHPIMAAGTLAGMYGGAKTVRAINEGNAMRGTGAQQKSVPAKPTKNQLTAKAIRGAVASNVSPEERKRRLQAEALRNAQ